MESNKNDREKQKFWQDNLQTLYLIGRGDVLVIRGRDIEACWTYGNDNFIRTRSGMEVRIQRSSWLKCRFENADFNVED